MKKTEMQTDHLTLGDVTFKTGGNILFHEDEDGNYFLARSTLLNKLDKAIQSGIVENGMQSLFKKLLG